MRKKHLPLQALFTRVIWISTFIGILIIYTGCNSDSSSKVPEPAEDWLNLTVQFQPNTSQAVKEASLNAIEQQLIDTIRQLRSAAFKDFAPVIVRTVDFIKDTQMYTFAVGFRDPFGRPMPPPPAITMAGPPKCLCQTDCRICNTLKIASVVPNPAPPPFKQSEVILNLFTSDSIGNKGGSQSIPKNK